MRSILHSVFTFVLSILFMSSITAHGQTIPLYSGPIPNSKPVPNEELTEEKSGMLIVSKITEPSLTIFLPDKKIATGTAVVICPGGGYWVNAIRHEGTDVAKEFNKMGVAAFVLKYRIPNAATMENKEIGALQDVQQAISLVRRDASKYGIDSHRIGLMGFSAGGHLASTAGTHFVKPVIETTTSVRPDFMILVYPVISFQDSVAHLGSREQIVGKAPDPQKRDFYSNELQVTRDTPPTFLVHASDDGAVKQENSILFYQRLLKSGVPAELHLYQRGGHGFGMKNPTTRDLWMERCRNWLESNGWLPTKQRPQTR